MKITAAVVSGLAAGILDMLGASVVYDLCLGVSKTGRIVQSVAGGLYGKETFNGGISTAVTGLALHFLIAMIFAFIYVYLFRNLSRKLFTNVLLTGIIYGCLVWLAMNYLVMPLSAYGEISHFKTFRGFAFSFGLIIICVGIPIALISESILRKKTISY